MEIKILTKIKKYGSSNIIVIPSEQMEIGNYKEGDIIDVTIKKRDQEVVVDGGYS